MYIFICVNASFICLQHFCFYSYRQCFHPPPPPSFPSSPKHRFPFPVSSSRLTQPKSLLTFAFFQEWLFFLIAVFFFYYNTNYYYCKVYLEETFVYYTITILSVTAGRKRNVENQQLNYLLFQTQHIQTLSFDSSLFF